MNKILLSTLFFITSLSLFSQNPMMGGGRPGGGQQMNGRFYGKLIEIQSGKPIDAASVQLIQNKFDTVTKKRKDAVINGMLTKSNGEFSMENVPLFGQFKIKITAIGFKNYEQPVSFEIKMGGGAPDMSAMLNAVDKDLGNIKMEIDAKVLGNVTVNSSKSLFQLGIDRKIFNVEKDLVSTGGTAVDVMKNIPSISVDIDGNVTLRNNAPQIFIDGRPTTMELNQIPADAIESVEIITNPSAKFDASGGTAGILNVVLKKNKKVGYNGSLRTNIDSRAKVGFGGDINLRQNKVNLFASVNINHGKSIGTGNTDRYNILDNPNTILYQDDHSTSNHNFGFGRAGFDFFVNNRNTISANVSMVRGKFSSESLSELLVDSLYNVKKSSYTERGSNSDGLFRRLGSQLSFKHNFPKPGRELTADATFNSRKNDNSNNIITDYFIYPSSTINNRFTQQQNGTGTGKGLVIQSDFVNPLTEKSKLEMGIRGSFNNSKSTNAFYTVSPTGQLILQPSSQIDYESNDHIIAGYTTFTNQLKKFGYQLGLRVESSGNEATLIKTNEKFKNDFPVSFFPSVFLSYKMKNDQDLQLNFSRRIGRPNFFQLSPYTDSSDFLNLSKGNPGLKPEFTNSVEFSYQKVFESKDNILTTVYFKNTNDLITRFQEKYTSPVNGKENVLNTYINANSSYVTGLETTMKNKITKIWELTSNLNLYTSKIKIDDPTQPKQDQFLSWYGKLNNTFKLPKNFTIQLSGEYQSKTILPPGGSGNRSGGGFMGMGFGSPTSAQGYVRPNYFVDAAFKYEFLKNKAASISLNINDIFRTRRTYVHSESLYFVQDVFRRRDPQVLRLNFNWRFGKFDPSLFKRKNMKGEREGMNNMDMN